MPCPPHPRWEYDKTFGIVHRDGCHICLGYMMHVNDVPLDKSTFSSYILATQKRELSAAEVLGRGDLIEEYQDEINQYEAQLKGAQREIDRMQHELVVLRGAYYKQQQLSKDVNTGTKSDSKESVSPDAFNAGTLVLGRGMDGDSCPEQAPAFLEDDISSPSPGRSTPVLESEEDEDAFHYPGVEFMEESIDNPTKSEHLSLDHHSVDSPSSLSPVPAPKPSSTSSSPIPDPDNSNDAFPSPSSSPFQPDHPYHFLYRLPLHITAIGKIRELMELAHSAGGEAALAQVRWLVSRAQATPPALRSEAHRVLLTEWRRPSSLNSSGLPTLCANSFPSEEYIYVDASEVGVGFVFANKWEAWRLRNGWKLGGQKQGKLRDIQWAEAVAVELGVRLMIKAGYAGREIKLCSDNMQVVQAFSRREPIGEPLANEVVANTCRLCKQLNICLRILWVSGLWNPADGPSRLNVGSEKARFPYHAEIPTYLQDVVMPFYQ